MSLVIWEYSRHPKEALKLVRFLTDYEFQAMYLRQAGYLPARQQALNSPPFSTDPHYHLLGQSLQTGRGFTAAYMWGLVEDRLTTAISELWQQVFADPHVDLPGAVADKLRPLAERLDRTLSTDSRDLRAG